MTELLDVLREHLADRYDVQRELGRGGMATVFLAEDLKHRRKVAVKVLLPDVAASIGQERFLREIEIAASLQHPHILPLYDSGAAGQYLYYVMPYVEGESLRDKLNREKQLPQEEVIRITQQVAAGLGHAHSLGVVHRDIKPENILLSSGTAVVADFGIARAATAAADQQSLTQTGTVIGTPSYMSPEQSTGQELDGRSDQYSLACVVYEMLVGAPPFTGPTPQAVMARHSLDMVSPPSIVRESIPETMEAALLRALAKQPVDRFPTIVMFADALGTPSTITAAVRRRTGTAPVAVRARSRWSRPALWGGGALLVLAAVVLVVRPWHRAGRGEAGRTGPGAQGAGLDPRHIAVRYFEDLSRDSSLGFVADGLTEALIEELGSVTTLRVVSRNGVAPYRGSLLPRDSIARALQVGSLIEGTVEPSGDRLRVTVRLIDGVTGADIGDRKTFDEPRGDLLKIRGELAGQVAEFLRGRLGEEVRLRELRAGTANVNAWVLAQQGEKARKDAEALRPHDAAAAGRKLAAADTLFAQAAAADPTWAEPIVQRGQLVYRQARLTLDPLAANPLIDQGLAFAAKALQLAPDAPDALELRGSLRYYRWLLHGVTDPGQAAALLRDAEADLRKAVELDPTLAGAWSTLSHLDNQKPDVVTAKIDATRAYEADAYYSAADGILWRLFTSSYDLEQFVDADHWCGEGLRRFPDNPRFTQCRLWMLTTRAKSPDVAEAWRLFEELHRLTAADDWAFEHLDAQIAIAAVLTRAGLVDSARHLLSRSRGTPDIDPAQDLLYSEAFARTLLGDKDEALRLLKQYIAGHEERRAELAKDYLWWFRDLRGDPRYQALTRQ